MVEKKEDFVKKRDEVYRMAYWLLIRKFHLNDMSDILDELALCCSVNEMNEKETEEILKETIDSYVKQKGIF